MNMRTIVASAAALTLISPAFAQNAGFPEQGKTLRIVVPFAAGGGVDNAARCSASNCASSSA